MDNIVELVRIKAEIDQLGGQRYTEYHLPRVAATESELRSVEDQVGVPLDEQYRQFLLHSNVWSAILLRIDLFGTSELVGGPMRDRAKHLVEALEPGVLDRAGVQRDDLLPIAVAR
jgi:hypothetical protein